MGKRDFYYNSQSKSWTKCLTLIVLIIVCFTVTTFSVFEISNFYADKEIVREMLEDDFPSVADDRTLKYELEQKPLENLLNSDRQARAAAANQTLFVPQKSNSYYEEQIPVLVHSESDIESPIARRQMAEIPPKQDTEDDDPYSKAYDSIYDDTDVDYFGQTQPKSSSQSAPYYSEQHQQQQQSAPPYYRQPPDYYSRQSQAYPDDSSDDFPGPADEQYSSQEARAAQYRNANNYYRPSYSYAPSPPAAAPAGMENAKRLSSVNNDELRNRLISSRNQAQSLHYRNPMPPYMDDYEYLPANSQSAGATQHPYLNRKSPPPEYRTPSLNALTQEKSESGQQMDFLTMFKSIKTMWDLYQSFTSSWNAIAERRNREQEELDKQKYKQQQQQKIRMNSRKPPKFNTTRNTTTTNKATKRPGIMNATATTIPTPVSQVNVSAKEDTKISFHKQPMAKVEPRNRFKGNAEAEEERIRDKRQTAAGGDQDSTNVGEGRYIKGDPLKGYYDFVITEGSYKFWAAFQVGTAILIIYSTFAAIYYSKVNPLVSDYDYTDYLGGARSLNGGDLDFVDDVDEETGESKSKGKSWLEWLPRSGHSLKFILEAIDKLPTDHNTEQEQKQSSEEVKTDAAAAYEDHEVEMAASAASSNDEAQQRNEDEVVAEESGESLASSRQPDEAAM